MSRKSRRRWFADRGRAENAVMDGVRTGQGGIQDRGVPSEPDRTPNLNPFIMFTDPVRMSRTAWALYAGDWAAQKIVDIPVFDMFREGWNWKYRGEDTDINEELQQAADGLGVSTVFSRGKRLERLLGGAVVIIGALGEKDSESQPLIPDMVDKGGLRFLNVVGRNLVTKVEWETDPSRPDYGRPRHYLIFGKSFHRSRLIVFDGNPASPCPGRDFMADISNWDGFGLSVFAPIYDALIRASSSQQAALHLVQTASVWMVLKKGLKDLQMARGGQRAVNDLQRIVEEMSMYRGAVLDGEDVDLKNIAASFGSVPELLTQYLQILSAASDIPATRFLGEAPGGLNSDGKSSLENYYNAIRARQRLELEPALMKRLLPLLLNSTFGRGKYDPKDIEIEWLPLWNMSKTDEAAIRTANAQTILGLNGAGILSDEEAVRELMSREVLARRPDVEDLARRKAEMRMLGGLGDEGRFGDANEMVGNGGGPGGNQTPKPPRLAPARNERDDNGTSHDADGKFDGGKGGGGGKAAESAASGESVSKRRTEIREKFSQAREARITGNEIELFAQGKSLREIRESMPDWAREHGITGEHENDDTGWDDVIVSRQGIRDSMEHGAHEEKIKAVAALPQLIKHGIYLHSEPAHNTRQIGMTSHFFAAKLDIGEKPFTIGYIIKEDMNGRRFYNHEMESLGGILPKPSGAAPTEVEGRLPDARQGLILTVLRRYLSVKPEGGKK